MSADRAVVWVDGWQMACCGTPFSVGDAVEWTVSAEVDRDFLERATSPDAAARIDYAEQHHDDDEPLLGFAGVVRRIRLASCRYRPVEGGGSSPGAGTGRLVDVAGSDERPPARQGEDRPGWIVEVEPFRVS